MMRKKHLSSIANDVLFRCAQKLDASVDELVAEYEVLWKPDMGDYSRKLVEFGSSKALSSICSNIEEMISDGSFSRLTYDMMLAWETPSYADEEEESCTESFAKEKEDKVPVKVAPEQDEIPLFYSDIMPLLVDNEPSVTQDAFVWLGSLVPLVVDYINGRFTFETLTASTANRLHFPAYDKYVKEIDKYMMYLQRQTKPKGVELADDEFIFHVEGTASTQRVVRHIGGTSWPGRLTLTNYALYFEASGVISYGEALKIDLSKNIEQSVKPVSTGPFGAPLFDKAITYESADLQEGTIFEFPEVASSTRRDHWLALVKEIKLLHQFLSKYKVESPIQAWELHSRTILGIIRLHAAREMLRISPPDPKSFLIFALYDELPKGDYVLEELAESLMKIDNRHPCSASSILLNMNVTQATLSNLEVEELAVEKVTVSDKSENLSLDNAIDQARQGAKEISVAKATTESLKEEGISDSANVLMELLKPARDMIPWFQQIVNWEKPGTTAVVLVTSLLIVYKEWVGKALAALMLWVVAIILTARLQRNGKKACNKIVVYTGSEQTTIESIVSAQHGLKTAQELVQLANISLLKIGSILVSKTPKHTDWAIGAITTLAIVLAVVPFKFILIGLILYGFSSTSSFAKRHSDDRGNRRLKEWWDSIPVIPVEVVDKVPESISRLECKT